MINHLLHLDNKKVIELEIAGIYGRLLALSDHEYSESSDFIEIIEMRNNVEKVLFPIRY